MERWVLLRKGADFEAIGKKYQISPRLACLIRNRDVIGEEAIERYLNGTISDLYDGMLMKDEKLRLKTVVPYTTRPMRAGEENGVSYYFCDEDTVEKLEAEGKIIELRAYHTIHGIWKYFTVADHQVDLDHQSYLLIGTLESYLKIREYFGTESVVPIYIEVEDGMRLQRALERERRQENPKYEELCRRFLADEKDFSEEKLKEAGITKRFCNESLEETENAIAAYIEEQE